MLHDFVVAVVASSVSLSCSCERLVGNAVVFRLTRFLDKWQCCHIFFKNSSFPRNAVRVSCKSA